MNLHLVIITGLSGAGKSQAIRAMEDLDYFCIDNLPPSMLHQFVLLWQQTALDDRRQRVAVCIDIRSGIFFNTFLSSLDQLAQVGITYEILFLDASEEALIRRFKEVRRPHPLSTQGRLQEGIRLERQRLKELQQVATRVIDTSNLSVHQLKARVRDFYSQPNQGEEFLVNVVSFGFKYDLPEDADLVFDVRFLPNPHWDPELRPLTGKDSKVFSYVMNSEPASRFFTMLEELLAFLIPLYIKEGKYQLVIAIGCTGGRHRSVACAIRLADFLQTLQARVHLEHRDVDALELEERRE
ncbi:MAG: RNase adapter RapZ [Symbiobacteriaceae bacterium]|nr:RNase adapter RapZ [Symbiobacteriaceae bacterium]